MEQVSSCREGIPKPWGPALRQHDKSLVAPPLQIRMPLWLPVRSTPVSGCVASCSLWGNVSSNIAAHTVPWEYLGGCIQMPHLFSGL